MRKITESLEDSRTPPVTPVNVKHGCIPQLLPNAGAGGVSALKREGSSDPFLNPIISQAHPQTLIRDTDTNTWLEVKDEGQETLRQALYIILFFFMVFNPFHSLPGKKYLLYNVIATLVQPKGFFQSKWYYKLIPALPYRILLRYRIIDCMASKTCFTSYLAIAQKMCEGSINKHE